MVPLTNLLCLGARTGQEVAALRELGFEDSIGLDIVPFDKSIVSLEENEQKSEFEVFPNPTSDYLFIKSTGLTSYQVTIYNLLGEIILESKKSLGDTSKVDLSGQHSGIYFVQIDTDKSSLTHKIILL